MKSEKLFDASVPIPAGADLAKITLKLPARPGVALFATAQDEPILLLSGANLRRMARTRLLDDEAEKSRRTRIRPVAKRIWFRRCHSFFETQLAYFNIVQAVYPDTCEKFLPRSDIWFVHTNPAVEYPFFPRTRQFNSDNGLYWGPFADGKSAARFLEVLWDLFGLCRRAELLAEAPDALPCPYAQMNRCASVCNGTISPKHYRNIVDRAIDFLNHPPETAIAEMKKEMQKLSAALKFEQAQQLMEKIKRIETLLLPAYRWVTRLEDFLVLVFQPGPPVKLPDHRAKQPSVSSFLIGPGWVDQIESFPLSKTKDGCRAILDHIQLTLMQEKYRNYGPQQQQLFTWTTHLLYRKNSHDNGLYLRFNENLTADNLAEKLAGHF